MTVKVDEESKISVWKLVGNLEIERKDARDIVSDCESKLKTELLNECLGRSMCKRGTKQQIKYLKNQIEFFSVKRDVLESLIERIQSDLMYGDY